MPRPGRRGSTMVEKTASVRWEGAGKKGIGKISTETGALKEYPYGFASRFEDDRKGTNPEEILGAAHAACFTMAFSFACLRQGRLRDNGGGHAGPCASDQTRRGIRDRPHRADAEGERAGSGPGPFRGAGSGRKARLPTVEGTGKRCRDHARCKPIGGIALSGHPARPRSACRRARMDCCRAASSGKSCMRFSPRAILRAEASVRSATEKSSPANQARPSGAFSSSVSRS